MMKKTLLVCILILVVNNCTMDPETEKLGSFLTSFAIDIKSFKVICFVPADGCSSCINPSIEYSKKASKDFLMVLSSLYKKSINYIIEQKKIEEAKIISDSQNLASSIGLVSFVSPCFYFLKNGHVVKKVDLSTTFDKTSVFKDVDKYLSK